MLVSIPPHIYPENSCIAILTGSGTVGLTHDVRHAGLVGDERGQMDGRRRLVLGEGLDLSAMTGGTLLRVESHGTMARRRKLAMRLELWSRRKVGLGLLLMHLKVVEIFRLGRVQRGMLIGSGNIGSIRENIDGIRVGWDRRLFNMDFQ